ncbi:hypothetical protein GLOTRDRAFT_134570 [Gloeophyllum trabeum ATCC 11539]|uniref:Uncharacterized protein n=1 Tax=Gloeophyllum trabeum (strain ATCC 11539 / FP-39264 / Madison 617) TaxID=670483 RepID=S7PR13_GLOTA|nr:uncharacterized protein GLOTRDRAFT_134570 [Gloeophyllum trabeum ATCC 11539]EPQ49822.1 hypothetical protein GLOTRDRAFT_134570 [Gloeophyllum trabeum ATCC 11539]
MHRSVHPFCHNLRFCLFPPPNPTPLIPLSPGRPDSSGHLSLAPIESRTSARRERLLCSPSSTLHFNFCRHPPYLPPPHLALAQEGPATGYVRPPPYPTSLGQRVRSPRAVPTAATAAVAVVALPDADHHVDIKRQRPAQMAGGSGSPGVQEHDALCVLHSRVVSLLPIPTASHRRSRSRQLPPPPSPPSPSPTPTLAPTSKPIAPPQ